MTYFPFVRKTDILYRAIENRGDEYRAYLGRKPVRSPIERHKRWILRDNALEGVNRRPVDTTIKERNSR